MLNTKNSTNNCSQLLTTTNNQQQVRITTNNKQTTTNKTRMISAHICIILHHGWKDMKGVWFPVSRPVSFQFREREDTKPGPKFWKRKWSPKRAMQPSPANTRYTKTIKNRETKQPNFQIKQLHTSEGSFLILRFHSRDPWSNKHHFAEAPECCPKERDYNFTYTIGKKVNELILSIKLVGRALAQRLRTWSTLLSMLVISYRLRELGFQAMV